MIDTISRPKFPMGKLKRQTLIVDLIEMYWEQILSIIEEKT